jgi:hypothetical protein
MNATITNVSGERHSWTRCRNAGHHSSARGRSPNGPAAISPATRPWPSSCNR